VQGYGVTVDAAGLVYVHAQTGPSSTTDMSVLKYGPTLNLLATYAGAPEAPTSTTGPRKGQAVSGIAVDSTGRALVASGNGFNGSFTSFLGRLVLGQPPFHGIGYVNPGTLFEGAAIDRVGHLYVADAAHDTVDKLSLSDTTQSYAQLGGTGTGQGDLSAPVGVAVDDDCSVYVSDSGNGRVQKLSYATGCG
jgi:sugar lactone lactonase YvrE